MKGRIGLITILSDDVQSMKEFYNNILGFEILEDLGRYVEFLNEGTRFAICSREVMSECTDHISFKELRSGQSFELAFPLDSLGEVDRIYEEIVSKGATPVKKPEMMPWGRRTAFFSDPEGTSMSYILLSQRNVYHSEMDS